MGFGIINNFFLIFNIFTNNNKYHFVILYTVCIYLFSKNFISFDLILYLLEETFIIKNIINIYILYILFIKIIYQGILIIFDYQLKLKNNLYTMYTNYFLILTDNQKLLEFYTTLTNINLKNYFIVSAIYIYILYFLSINELVLKLIHLLIKSIKYNEILNKIFYLKFHLLHLDNFLIICIIISLHICLGLYMLFFDYFKKSSFLLFSVSIYVFTLTLNLILIEIYYNVI